MKEYIPEYIKVVVVVVNPWLISDERNLSGYGKF